MSDAVVIECANTVTPAVASPPTKASVATTYKVIGFKTNPKSCYKDMVIFEVRIGSTSVSLVWDAANNVIYTEPVATSDTTYQAWYAKQGAKPSDDMFPSLTVAGADALDTEYRNYLFSDIAWSYSEQPTRCPQLVTSDKDWEVWNYPFYPPMIYPVYFQQYMSAKKTLWYVGYNYQWGSKYCTCPIPSPFVTGFYTKDFYDEQQTDRAQAFLRHYKREFIFPYGDPVIIEKTGGGPAGGYPFDRAHFSTINIFGQYGERILADVFVAQYQISRYYADWTQENISNHRKVYAQTIFDEGGVSGKDWVAQGSNTALEAKIESAIDLAYTIRGGGSPPSLGVCTINITIL